MCNLLLLLTSAVSALTLSRAGIISERTPCNSVEHTGRLRVYENLAINSSSAMYKTEAFLGNGSAGDPFSWVVRTEDTSTFSFAECAGKPFTILCTNCGGLYADELRGAVGATGRLDSNEQLDDLTIYETGYNGNQPVPALLTDLQSVSWTWADGTFLRLRTQLANNTAQYWQYGISDANHHITLTANATVPIPDAYNVYYSLAWEED